MKQYRIRCSGAGKIHERHRYLKRDLATALKAADETNAHIGKLEDWQTLIYGECYPYVAEEREISAWAQASDEKEPRESGKPLVNFQGHAEYPAPGTQDQISFGEADG